eukprot:5926189-Amphidinium_carterae.1
MVDWIHHAYIESTGNRERGAVNVKASMRLRGPQNDGDSIEGRICASFANSLLNLRVVSMPIDHDGYAVDDCACGDPIGNDGRVRSLDVILDELGKLLQQRVIPCAPQGMISYIDQNNLGNGGELFVDGVSLPCHRSWAILDGQQPHEVTPVRGQRWSIMLHTPQELEKVGEKVMQRMYSMGFPKGNKAEGLDQGGSQQACAVNTEIEETENEESHDMSSMEGLKGEPETWLVFHVLGGRLSGSRPTGQTSSNVLAVNSKKLCMDILLAEADGNKRLTDLGWKRSEENLGTWMCRVKEDSNKHACLVTYVDALRLVAPSKFADTFWRSLERQLEFKEMEAPLYRYLGAKHVISGGMMKVEMCGYAQKAVDRFEAEPRRKLRVASTPYVADGIEKEALGSDACGCHAKTASSHIATLLFLARMSRPDLMTAVMKLSRWVSKWETAHDLQLKRLFEYLKGTVQTCLNFQILHGTPMAFIVWTDTDLNGDVSDSKRPSGNWVELKSVGSSSSWPITWNSKCQGWSAYATCEAETIALNKGSRDEGIPLHGLVETIIGRRVRMVCREDNAKTIAALQRGSSKNLRHLPRIHRISIGALN